MSKKVLVVDQDLCIGCNTCPLIAGEYFELDTTDFKAKVKKQPESSDNSDVQNAIDSCPVTAIKYSEEK